MQDNLYQLLNFVLSYSISIRLVFSSYFAHLWGKGGYWKEDIHNWYTNMNTNMNTNGEYSCVHEYASINGHRPLIWYIHMVDESAS